VLQREPVFNVGATATPRIFFDGHGALTTGCGSRSACEYEHTSGEMFFDPHLGTYRTVGAALRGEKVGDAYLGLSNWISERA
jgi:hypothetical protein